LNLVDPEEVLANDVAINHLWQGSNLIDSLGAQVYFEIKNTHNHYYVGVYFNEVKSVMNPFPDFNT